MQNHVYKIKGPMGRGLGLTKDSKGTYVAFSAGTGIVVFIDLVARLALQELKSISSEQCLPDGFKFVLFASF